MLLRVRRAFKIFTWWNREYLLNVKLYLPLFTHKSVSKRKKVRSEVGKTVILNQKTNCHRQWHPTPVLLPGKSHGQRSLVGCSPWGHEESDTTERLHFHFSLSLFTFTHWRKKWQPTPVFSPGESQGWGAWWAVIYGVAQSRTQLRWLSSSRNIKILNCLSTPGRMICPI